MHSIRERHLGFCSYGNNGYSRLDEDWALEQMAYHLKAETIRAMGSLELHWLDDAG